jgi:hypothetical protein
LRVLRLVVPCIGVLFVAACSEGLMTDRPAPRMAGASPSGYTAPSSFSEAGGVVIPSEKPDAEALAFAAKCNDKSATKVAMGMSECALIGLKGAPSRVISALDQAGRAHNAIWYVESGQRLVYKFDDDRLVEVIR